MHSFSSGSTTGVAFDSLNCGRLWRRKLTPKRLVVVIMSMLAITSSRRWFPDHAQLPLYTTALLSLGGLLVLLVSFHIEYVFPNMTCQSILVSTRESPARPCPRATPAV